MSGALDGLRVLDLSTGIAGPLATMVLADFGADVVKVEPAAGDPGRRLAGFAMWNRNKRSVLADSRIDAFLAGADVCVVGDACPELDPAALSAQYPRLVVLHVPPYTPTATPWCGAESHALLSAMGGAARRQSSHDGGPIELVYPLPLYVQGLWGAACSVAALVEREKSGFGQVVSVSGIHAVLVSCVGQLLVVPSQQSLPTNVGPGGRHPLYTTYQAQDGEWLFLAALTPKFQVNAFRVLGVDVFADERIQGIPARMLLPENRVWIRELLADRFCTRPRDEWLALLEQGDCPAGPICERDTWLDHPSIRANGLRLEVDDPERGQVVMPGVPLVLTGSPGEVRTPAPRLGEHHALVEPWPPQPAPSDAAAPSSSKGPLDGMRVLDLGTILAGPYAGALLAELGADVVKVESPAGDPFRETGFVYNRGQRGLAIDLTSAAARDAFYAVVRKADVVLDNSRRGVLERLGIDYERLSRANPRIVTLSVTGFGERGPLAAKPGFDPVLQAMSGMMAAQGGDSEPVLFTIPVNDIAAGVVAVLGICLGLYHRSRTGAGQRTWTSLLGCSTLMQSGELVRFEGRTPPIRGGRDFAGPSPLDRYYSVQDGWIRIQAPDAESLRAAGVLATDARDSEAALYAALTDAFAALSLADALASLRAAGIPCAPARMPADLPTDALLQPLDIFATQTMQDGTPFYLTNRYARFSRTQSSTVFTAPGTGEHSREILTQAGVPSADIEALIESGAVKQGTPFRVVAIQNYR